MDGNSEYTYPRFRFDIKRATASFKTTVENRLKFHRIIGAGAFTDIQYLLDSFKAVSMTESSTWVVKFHKHGFVITDTAYTDEDFNWFSSVEQAMDKHMRGLGISADVWKLTAESDRVLTKRDKREIMRLYDGSDEAEIAREMEDVE